MGAHINTELEAFRSFVGEKLTNDGKQLSPEECLELWRAEHPSPRELEESVPAVKEALADMDAGDRGRPLDEVVDDLRAKLDLPHEA